MMSLMFLKWIKYGANMEERKYIIIINHYTGNTYMSYKLFLKAC